MSLWLGLALIAGAYFAMVSGMTFVALILFALAILMILTRSTDASKASDVSISEPFGKEGPIVVENKMPDIPSRINFKIHPKWQEYAGFEYDMFNTGWAANNLGHFFYNLITGAHRKRAKGS